MRPRAPPNDSRRLEGASATAQQDVGGAAAAVAGLGGGEGEDASLEAWIAEPFGERASQDWPVRGTQPLAVYDQHAPLSGLDRLAELFQQGPPRDVSAEPVEIDVAIRSNSTAAQAPKLTRLDPGGDAE